MPVKLGRDGAAGEGVEQEIALVGEVLDPRGEIDLGGHMIECAGIGDEIAFEPLVGVADEIGIVDRPVEPARIARRGGQREAVVAAARSRRASPCVAAPAGSACPRLTGKAGSETILGSASVTLPDRSKPRQQVALFDHQLGAVGPGAADVLDEADRGLRAGEQRRSARSARRRCFRGTATGARDRRAMLRSTASSAGPGLFGARDSGSGVRCCAPTVTDW